MSLEEIRKAKAICKGYDDGLALLAQYPHISKESHYARSVEWLHRAHIALDMFEHYYSGFRAAWINREFNLMDEFIKDTNGASSEEQAYMRDLEQS